MRSRDVFPYEMSDFLNIDESDLRALSRGQVPSDDPRLGDVAAFLADLDAAIPQPSIAHCEARHLSAMFEQAHLLADKGEPALTPASKADGPEEQVSGLPKPRRKTMLDKLKGSPVFAMLKGASFTAKIMVVTTAFMALFSGMAFAGVLPGPLQDVTADAVSAAGIDLPGGADEPSVPEAVQDVDADDVEDIDDADDADDAVDADDDAEDIDDADDADDDAEDIEDIDDADDADDDAEDIDDADDAADDAEADDDAEDADDDAVSGDDSSESDDSDGDEYDSED